MGLARGHIDHISRHSLTLILLPLTFVFTFYSWICSYIYWFIQLADSFCFLFCVFGGRLPIKLLKLIHHLLSHEQLFIPTLNMFDTLARLNALLSPYAHLVALLRLREEAWSIVELRLIICVSRRLLNILNYLLSLLDNILRAISLMVVVIKANLIYIYILIVICVMFIFLQFTIKDWVILNIKFFLGAIYYLFNVDTIIPSCLFLLASRN